MTRAYRSSLRSHPESAHLKNRPFPVNTLDFTWFTATLTRLELAITLVHIVCEATRSDLFIGGEETLKVELPANGRQGVRNRSSCGLLRFIWHHCRVTFCVNCVPGYAESFPLAAPVDRVSLPQVAAMSFPALALSGSNFVEPRPCARWRSLSWVDMNDVLYESTYVEDLSKRDARRCSSLLLHER